MSRKEKGCGSIGFLALARAETSYLVSTLHHNDTVVITSVLDHHRAQMASGFGLNGGTFSHFLDPRRGAPQWLQPLPLIPPTPLPSFHSTTPLASTLPPSLHLPPFSSNPLIHLLCDRIGPSRCFPFWQDLLACYVVNTTADDISGGKKCLPVMEDYYECLHHKKEVRSSLFPLERGMGEPGSAYFLHLYPTRGV